MRKPLNEKGVILIVAMLFVALSFAFIAGAIKWTNNEAKLTKKRNESIKAFYAAEAGAEQALFEVRALYAGGTIPSQSALDAVSPPTISGYTFDVFSIVLNGNSFQGAITSGPYQGLQATIQPIRITSQATSTGSTQARAKVIQDVEAQFISVFQFGVFYEEDLEVEPGPTMNFAGPVHANGDIYLGAGSQLNFDSYLTSAGDIFHDRKDSPGNGANGAVLINDNNGDPQDMNQSGVWLDSTQSNWATESQTRWGGMVKSKVHGIAPLTLPIFPADPHDIIERANAGDPPQIAAAKYENKAGLKIVDGITTDGNGNPVTLAPGIVTNDLLYNYREGDWINITSIDIATLRTSGQYPANGIIYVSQSGSNQAVRLVNGSQLPPNGLTVASDNSIYIQGDYNTVNKQPSSVAADAFNVLSNNWDDANSSQSLSNRRATATTINTAVMTGNTDTVGSSYNGGLENLPRFLEDWSGGTTFTYSGAIVDLWNSEQATGQWFYGGNFYKAPVRNWGYDTMFSDPANMPPGTPSVQAVQRIRWSQQ